MRTPWVRGLVVFALALLIGYLLGSLQPTEGERCLHCGRPVAAHQRAPLCEACAGEYRAAGIEEGQALARPDPEAELIAGPGD